MKISTLTRYVAAPLCMAIAFPLAALAAPPDRSHLPQDAKWVIHLDLKALGQTDAVEQARSEQPQMAQILRTWLQGKYGVDPREDLESLTMFSNTYEAHSGTMILKAGYDQDKVKAALEENPDVKKETWENYTFYTVIGQGPGLLPGPGGRVAGARQSDDKPWQSKPMTLVLVDDQTVVFASSPDRARAAAKLVQGGSATLAEDSPLLSELKEEALLYGAAIELGKIEQREGIFPVLRQHDRIYWTIRKDNGNVVENLTLHAHSDQVAEQMKTALEGSVAFGKVWAADSQNLTKLMESRQVSRDGKTVQLTGKGDSQTVIAAMGELRDRFQQRLQIAPN